MLSVHAVIVTYNPDVNILSSHVDALLHQVDVVHVIDNTNAEDERVLRILSPLPNRIRLVRLGENLGIAKALNRGISNALNEGATHILTMDQDSLVSTGMVGQLLSVIKELVAKGEKVAAVAPVYFDVHRNIAKPYHQIISGRMIKLSPSSDHNGPYSEVIAVITSGCLYPREIFQAVGGFEDDFFIDYVDHEWCFRAKAHGFKVFCCWNAKMNHSLGDSAISIPMTKRRITVHSPIRNYYFFRNAVSLFKRDYVPRTWKVFIANDLFFKMIAAIIFSPPRMQRLNLIMRGIWHGLVGKMGKLIFS